MISKNKKPTLLRAMLNKEKIFWKRTKEMWSKSGWIGFVIAIIFITIGHYLFAGMTFLSEVWFWIIRSPQFKINVEKMCKT